MRVTLLTGSEHLTIIHLFGDDGVRNLTNYHVFGVVTIITEQTEVADTKVDMARNVITRVIVELGARKDSNWVSMVNVEPSWERTSFGTGGDSIRGLTRGIKASEKS